MSKALLVKAAIRLKIIIVQKKTDSRIFYSIIFEKLLQFQIFMKRGHLILINTTHNTNWLY